MERRRLGRTELYVSPIGLGGAWLGRTSKGTNDDIAVATVIRALELGINLIDTSAVYIHGQSEVYIGMGLQEWFKNGGRREEVVISTKTGTRNRPADYSASGTRKSVEQSLEALKTDYIDVVLVHDPGNLDPVVGPGGALEELNKLKSEGLVKAMGLGVRSHEFHRRLIESGECEVSLTYGDFNLIDQSAKEDLLETASAFDVGVFNGMAIYSGLLGGSDPMQDARHNPKRPEVQRAARLWKWASLLGVNLLSLNLQFCMREKRIASTLVGASSPEQIEVDVAAAMEDIPESVWQELRSEIAGDI